MCTGTGRTPNPGPDQAPDDRIARRLYRALRDDGIGRARALYLLQATFGLSPRCAERVAQAHVT